MQKALASILSGVQDKNISFSDLYNILIALGFSVRIKGDHHIFTKADRYIAEVPELPGCMADGETRMEVLNNVETIISEWLETANLEGREIPVPKGKLAYA